MTVRHQLCLPLPPTPKALLPIRAIGTLNRTELINLCVDDLFTLMRERRADKVLLVHAVQVLRKLNFGLLIHRTPRPGVVQVHNLKFGERAPLRLEPLPIGMLMSANNQFV